MPEHRLERTRRAYGPDDALWRPPSANAAARLERLGRQRCARWCPQATGYDPMIRAWRCACGERVITVDAAAHVGGRRQLEDRVEDFTDLDQVADRGHFVSNDPPLECEGDEPDEPEIADPWAV